MILANPRAPPQHGKSAHTHDSIITMLRFLARDGSNAEVIAKLKRSADASAVTSKAKKILTSNSSSKTPVPPLAVVPKPVTFQLPATANVSALTSREALEIIQQFKSEDYFVECGNTISAPEDEPELIPREVVEVVESLRVAIEIKFGEKKCASKPKFTGRTKKPFLTWKQRADMLYFAMHPGFANGDIFLAAEVFDIPEKTIRSWLNNTRCYSNWIPFAKSLLPYKVQQVLPSKTAQVWKDLPAE